MGILGLANTLSMSILGEIFNENEQRSNSQEKNKLDCVISMCVTLRQDYSSSFRALIPTARLIWGPYRSTFRRKRSA